MSFVNTIDQLGDSAVLKSIVEGTIAEFRDDVITRLKRYSLYPMDSLKVLELPNVTTVEQTALKLPSIEHLVLPKVTSFSAQSTLSIKLKSVDLQSLEHLSAITFSGCTNLSEVSIPSAKKFKASCFRGCTSLKKLDFHNQLTIDTLYVFNGSGLDIMIMRSTTISTLSNTNALVNTPIADGTGYIYVPRALVDSYKVATNWSTFANQFRAIEDYPDICG